MPLAPALRAKLRAALMPAEAVLRTPRDAALPAVAGKVHAVIGMRRAGKTTFLQHLRDDRRKNAPPEQALYISFDDDRLNELKADQLSLFLEEYYRLFPGLRGKTRVHWYLDEIQLVPGWERFCRRVLDTELIDIVVSGSSSKMLSKEVHTSLRGRGMATVIRPFSFREYLRHRGEEPPADPAVMPERERVLIDRRFVEFLSQGGFPETQGLPTTLRDELVQGYVNTVLLRDVVERHHITQVEALRWILRHCLRNPCAHLSAHRLQLDLRAQGLGIGKDTIHAILGHVTDAFLFSPVSLATESERQRNSNPRKFYPADPGLIHAFDRSGRTNIGHALECAVLNELERRGAEVGYVKTTGGFEVDFLARYADAREELIQVCDGATDETTLEREVRALLDARASYPRAKLYLMIRDREREPHAVPDEVEVLRASEWMLSPMP